jgi:hypothetical protein
MSYGRGCKPRPAILPFHILPFHRFHIRLFTFYPFGVRKLGENLSSIGFTYGYLRFTPSGLEITKAITNYD